MRVLRRELRLQNGDSNLLLIICHAGGAGETVYVWTWPHDESAVFTMEVRLI